MSKSFQGFDRGPCAGEYLLYNVARESIPVSVVQLFRVVMGGLLCAHVVDHPAEYMANLRIVWMGKKQGTEQVV